MTHFKRNFGGIFHVIILTLPCLAQDPSAESHIQRARQFIAEAKTDEAIREYKEAVAAEPGNIEAQGNLGVLQFFSNNCSEALPHLMAALAANSAEGRIQALAGICQRKLNRLDEAAHNLAEVLPFVKNPKIRILVLTNLVEIEAARADFEDAGAHVGELVKNDASNPATLYLAYRIYTELADSARNALTITASDSAQMHLLTAERFINHGNASLAIKQYRLALAKAPSMLGIHYELGEAILQESTSEDSLKRAQEELILALKEDPRNAGAEAKLGFIEGVRGRTDLAEQHHMHALSLNPDEFNALVGLGDIFLARGEDEKAVSYLDKASKIDAMDDSLHYRLAQIFRRLGKRTEADQEFKLFKNIRELKNQTELRNQERQAP